MKFRETIYPYNFNFKNEILLQHWHITRFLNELHSSELFTLEFTDGQLFIQFNGIFKGLGFRRYHFERKNPELAQRTLRELSRGLIRFKKISKGSNKMGINFYINILKNEDRNSEVVDIVTKLNGLITSLKTSGVTYLEGMSSLDSDSECYVSPLLLSYWIERWDTFNGSTLDDGFWDSVTYSGNLRSLEAKMIAIKEYWTRTCSLNGLTIYFPQQRYVLIQDVTESSDIDLKFTNYNVQYFPSKDLSTLGELQAYVDGRHLSLIHIIPHFLIYHIHNFNTSDDLTHYLEWSIFRSQRELPDYTSSVPYENGLRFTRGCLISFGVTPYQRFLNFVLWNTVYFMFPTNSVDYLQWKGILLNAFRRFTVAQPDFIYYIDQSYPAPKIQRDYIREKLKSIINVNDCSERLIQLLRNYLDVTHDTDITEPEIQHLGRTEGSQRKNLPMVFSELPADEEFKPIILSKVQFVQARIQPDLFKYQKVSMRRNLIGGVSIPLYSDTKPHINVRNLFRQIQEVRNSEYLRTLAKKVSPCDVNRTFSSIADILLQDCEITVSLWFGLVLHFTDGKAVIESVSSDNDDDPSTYGLECTLRKTVMTDRIVRINSSTPKLLSVFDTLFHYLSGLDHNRTVIKLSLIKEMLRNVLILGAVDSGDPLGVIFQEYFHSSVSQVGGFGIGKVIRAEASHFEFNVSYTAIISDIDMGAIESQDDLDRYLSNIIIKYMQNIEPKIGVFKINYGTMLMMEYTLEYLQREFSCFYDYTLLFVTPQFGKMANFEKYLLFIKHDNTRRKGSYLILQNSESALFNDRNRLCNIEHQCSGSEDFNYLSKDDFPRLYYFITSQTSELRDVLTVLSHRSDRIITSRSFGSDSISYYATLNPARLRLCLRVPTFLKLTSQLSERFNVEHLSSSEYLFQREERILSLGNFYRELCRVQILMDDQGEEVLTSLDAFTSVENEFHYLGIGDERARNILCVPPTSPYTIYDKKNYPQLTVFHITYMNQYFPFLDVDAINQLIRLEYNRHQRKLKIFFLFMIFNEVLTKDLILERIVSIARMMSENREFIQCIYFNTYLEFFGLPNIKNIILNRPYTLFNDINISLTGSDGNFKICGTFSKNYDLVELLRYHEIQEIADSYDVRLLTLPLHANHVSFTLWNLGLSPSSFDMSGLTIANEFCPVLKFE